MATSTVRESDVIYDRLITFTDGIFSIAVTLMALEIRVPDIENRAELGRAILDMLPQISIFAFSFVQVGLFWLAHQRMFRHIERSDSRFMVMNVVYLLLIAFIPVPSATLGRYGTEFPSVVFFALTLMLVGIMELIIWIYASDKRRLLNDTITPSQIASMRWRTASVIAVFGLSILIAFISPSLAMLSWFGLFVTGNLITRFVR